MKEEMMYGMNEGYTKKEVEEKLRAAFSRSTTPNNSRRHPPLVAKNTPSDMNHDLWSQSRVRSFFGEDEFEKMLEAGMTFSNELVLHVDQVKQWNRWINGRSPSPVSIPVQVDPVNQSVVFRGRDYDCDRTIALILKCLIDARGEIRSTGDIKRAFPDEPWEERLDLTIQRKLIPHRSGVGKFVKPISKRGYRFCIEAFE